MLLGAGLVGEVPPHGKGFKWNQQMMTTHLETQILGDLIAFMETNGIKECVNIICCDKT